MRNELKAAIFFHASKIHSIPYIRFLCSLVPRVCDVILEVCSVQDLTSDQYLGDELMFNMLLLSEVLCIPGKPYIIYHKSEERYFNV